jgi:hypothetical protein
MTADGVAQQNCLLTGRGRSLCLYIYQLIEYRQGKRESWRNGYKMCNKQVDRLVQAYWLGLQWAMVAGRDRQEVGQ